VEAASMDKEKSSASTSNATISKQPAIVYQWEVSLRFGTSADLDTVCDDGWLYGPYFLTGTDKPETSDTQTVSAEPSTVDLINIGDFAMCIQISSPIDMTLSIKDYSVDVTTCDEDPADFAGTWVGTYSCFNEGCADEINEPITLYITQNDHSAQYTDDQGATFEGTVCGNEFVFNGGVEGPGGYFEKGKFTMNSDGTLNKESSFLNNNGSCRGDCEDFLERQ
jgi:chitodextrinase